MATWNQQQQQQQPWEEDADPNAAWAGYAPTAASSAAAVPAVPAAQWQQPQPQPQQYYPQQQWQQPAPAANWNQPQQQQWQQPLPPNPHQQQQQWNAPKPVAAPPMVDWKPPALNDPMLNAGLQAGKMFMGQQLEDSLGNAKQSYTSYTAQLKAMYFNVNNAFVLAKLRTLLFPFTKKQWARSSEEVELGRKDVNAPDLYLPLMALSTYVLAVGLAKGTTHVFNPEIIVEVFGSSVFSQLIQVVVIKVAMYLLVGQNMQVSWLDLLAYTGYQYIGVAINMLVGVCFGPVAYNVCLAWTAACAAFVMFKTMQQVVGGTADSQKKLYFIVLCAALQVALMWFLGFTRDLRSSGNGLAVDVFGGNSVQIPVTTAFPEETVIHKTTAVAEEDDYEESEAVKARKAKRRAKKQQKATETVVDV